MSQPEYRRSTCAGILEQSMGARNRVGIELSYRPASAGIVEQSMGSRNRVGIGWSYRPAMLYRLAKSIPWNRCLGSIKVLKYRLIGWRNRFLGIDSWATKKFKNTWKCSFIYICMRFPSFKGNPYNPPLENNIFQKMNSNSLFSFKYRNFTIN
jgi:hypothetical protein